MDVEKKYRLYTLLAEWQIQAEKLEALLEAGPNDFLTTQYVLYAGHAAQLEAILNE